MTSTLRTIGTDIFAPSRGRERYQVAVDWLEGSNVTERNRCSYQEGLSERVKLLDQERIEPECRRRHIDTHGRVSTREC